MTRDQFAKFCGVATGTVTNWMDGGMPAIRNGQGARAQIDPRAAIPWVIKHREPPGSQRERLASEQADKISMENELRRGRQIQVALVEETMMAQAAYLARAHDAVAGRLAHELSGIDDPGLIRSKLLAEMRDIRNGAAEFSIRTAETLERVAEELKRGEGAAESDAERVGGSVPVAPRRKRRTRKVAKQ